ncbi:MAG: hypothetical protein M1827_000911 [Pycnora praestabilis]|nr:MAG: hypothetical protein M1827_000911 [Pycnora praestabilis]
MPNRPKRNLEDFDPNKSDSNDSTYSASAARPPRTKSQKSQPRKPPRKKQRRAYGEGSDDMSEDDDLNEEESFAEEEELEEEEVETDPRTGRPKRQSVKKLVKYEESDDDSETFAQEEEAQIQDEEDVGRKKRKRLLVKLKTGTSQVTPGPSNRTRRARSSSYGLKQGRTPEVASGGTRRSSRIAHDEQETIVALTNSGHHAEVIRPGTHSPEGIPSRRIRGGKGIKAPVTSAIFEEEERTGTPTLVSDKPGGEGQEGERIIGVVAEGLKALGDTELAYREGDFEEIGLVAKSETQNATQGDTQAELDTEMGEGEVIADSAGEIAQDDDDNEDDDEGPVSRGGRANRTSTENRLESSPRTRSRKHSSKDRAHRSLRPSRDIRSRRSSRRPQKGVQDESSDFEPAVEEAGEDDVSSSEASQSSPRKGSQRNDEDDESNSGRRSRRLAKEKPTASARSRQRAPSEEHDSEVAEELAEELEDLRSARPRRAPRPEILYDDKPRLRGRTAKVDYRIFRPDLALQVEDPEPVPAASPSRRGGRGNGGGTGYKSLFSTHGPFGGAGGLPPVFGGPGGIGAAGGVDSDSSDDDGMQRPRGVGGNVGMTPTSAIPPGPLPSAQVHGADPAQALSGTPANLGRVKDKQALADADPLGVDQNVNFDGVGGLEGHIDQLKEMVSLPLLYPEIFSRFHVTPPRGVLFHGPPGTGKTLLARALASSVSSHGRKVTFYMRKGADALSKWVGEAERQLRLLFEEARKTQPSIIFFDEIDGLAPVRSSKQEQIHASIVSTLLALMDGMDGRGQVIVIGATNRPDSIDPALRRPGRFDREFYFPLPNTAARRAILDIHTKEWQPPLDSSFKDQLAELTKGYGGADLRALCTEAALNAVQRRYPQIYKSNEKLIIDPTTITISAKDFMISIKRMVPSSERGTTSGAAPLPEHIEPLLRQPLQAIKEVVAEVLPQKKQLTALEEAGFDDAQDAGDQGGIGFGREKMQQEFEKSRVFRPRLLIRGFPGMGQQYLAGALLNHFEGLHVQSFDLPTLLSDSTRSPEASVVQLFTEVRRHKPSVIYIPSVDIWYRNVGPAVISTFVGLLRSLAPTDPILLLGVLESDPEYVDKLMLRDLFGYSRINQFELERPQKAWRYEYFGRIIVYLKTPPSDFPDPMNRKRRKLEQLEIAPPPPVVHHEPTKGELKTQKKKDRVTLNMLKVALQPVMDQIRLKHRKFRTPVVDENSIGYLFDEQDPDIVSTDLPQQQRQQQLFRPYEVSKDDKGTPGLLEVASGRFFYNMDTVIIEKRLSNGYYTRTQDFLADIKKLAKDAKTSGDVDRTLKANELLSNVEVDMAYIETTQPALMVDCHAVHLRQTEREKAKNQKATAMELELGVRPTKNILLPGSGVPSDQPSSGPIVLGEPVPAGPPIVPPVTPFQPSQHSSLSNGHLEFTSNVGEAGSQPPRSNGSSAPSRGDGDVHMTDLDDGPHTQRDVQQPNRFDAFARPLQDSQLQPQQPHTLLQQQERSGHSSRAFPSGTNTQFSMSQKHAVTPMPQGSQVDDFINDASTTTSGKKTSDHSNRSSGPYFNTQSSNGIVHKGEGPEFSVLGKGSGGSQLPDTQEMALSQNSNLHSSQSQPSQSGSQQPPVPPFRAPPPPAPPQRSTSIQALLNNPAPNPIITAPAATPTSPPVPAHPPLIIKESYMTELHEEFTTRTSGCSIEQLEQINTSLMDCIWKQRGEWNRTKVGKEVQVVFNGVILDVEEMQEILPASLATQ